MDILILGRKQGEQGITCSVRGGDKQIKVGNEIWKWVHLEAGNTQDTNTKITEGEKKDKC